MDELFRLWCSYANGFVCNQQEKGTIPALQKSAYPLYSLEVVWLIVPVGALKEDNRFDCEKRSACGTTLSCFLTVFLFQAIFTWTRHR